MSEAKSCPNCRGTAMEAREIRAVGNVSILAGYYWYCFNDGYTEPGVDCELNGPVEDTSELALAAWNALDRARKDSHRVGSDVTVEVPQ